MGRCCPQTSELPRATGNGSVPMHRPSEGWAGSGCAPQAGERGQAWAQVGACITHIPTVPRAMPWALWQQQSELCDRIRAALAEGTPALQPCLDRLVQPGLGDLLAVWKFRGRSSVVSAESRLAQKEMEISGHKHTQTGNYRVSATGSRLWNTTLPKLKGTSHRLQMQRGTLRNVLSEGAACCTRRPSSWGWSRSSAR